MVKKETVITVDASQAGTGKVTCRIHDSNGHDIDIDIIENPDNTFSIQFTPQFPGTYSISIQFGGQSIPEGEYTIEVSKRKIWLNLASCLVTYFFIRCYLTNLG